MTRRLLFSYLSLTIVVLAMLEVPLGFVNAHNELSDLTAKVERDAVAAASLAESTLEGEPTTANLPALDRLAARYASDTGGRMVITDANGAAIVDSAPLATGEENFGSRPEFKAALRGEVATGTRGSQTLGYGILYVAVPIASGGTVHGAVRITYPTSRLDERIRNYWLALAGIAVIAMVVATLVGLRFARWIRRPLDGLEEAAGRAGAGDLTARATVPDGPPELRTLALVFNDMVGRLDALIAAQRDFVADASHELRTPLTALRLRLENLERQVTPEGRPGVEAATVEVDRLSTLVDSLLTLVRADAVTTATGTIDITVVARECVDAWQPALKRGVTISFAAPEVVNVRAGGERVRQTLDNLLANALRAAPDGSVVTLTVRQLGSTAQLVVGDHGPGMTVEEKARAFDRFWRGDSGEGGSGLGLAIARRLVELDGGTIELRDAPAAGLDAVVTYPVSSGDAERVGRS
jgi:signal transduction histidine kinase